MWSAREAIATTSFVGVMDREKGFEGSDMTAGVIGVSVPVRWTWIVESHDAETTILCSLL